MTRPALGGTVVGSWSCFEATSGSRGGPSMQRGRVLAGVVLATVLMLTGCATGSGGKGKVRLSVAKMCNASHGSWVAGQNVCNPSPQSPKQGRAICEEQ